MKAIQISIDEEQLQQLDADPEVQEHGRSAVIREAIREYFIARREQNIRAAYARGYASDQPAFDEEFPHWAEQGQWPPD